MRSRAFALLSALLLVSCGRARYDPASRDDGGSIDVGAFDAGVDVGAAPDAFAPDAFAATDDAFAAADAFAGEVDASAADAGADPCATAILCEDFEGALDARWIVECSAGVGLEPGSGIDGSTAWLIPAGMPLCTLKLMFAPTTVGQEIHVRFWARWPDGSNSTEVVAFYAEDTRQASIVWADGPVSSLASYFNGTGGPVSTIGRHAGRWTCAEATLRHGVDGFVRMTLDDGGAVRMDVDTDAPPTAWTEVRVGANGAIAGTLCMDEIAISLSPLPCP